jgi:sn-glycerol 3-phosphate transport system substrate-binding protein
MLTRRTLSGLFAGALGAAAAGGCKPERLPPGHISLWFSYGGRNRKVLLELVKQFHREQHAVRVLPTFQGDYFEGLTKLRTGLFIEQAPTVTHVIGEALPYLAEAQVLEPLEDVGSEVLDDLVPALSQAGTFVGGGDRPLVGLPFNRSTPVAYYNKSIFRQLGIGPPKTWTELRSAARTACLRDGARTTRFGFSCPVDWWFWVAMVGQAGGEIVTPSGEVTLGDRAGVRALRLWQTMVHDERSMKPPPGRDYNAWEAANNDFLAGRVAMIWTSTAFLRYLEDNAPFAVGTAPLPSQQRAAVSTGGTFFVVPKGARPEERRAAMTFLRWMMAPAQANAWATRTGYMTVSKRGRAKLAQDGFFAQHPNDRVTVEQLQHARPWPWATQLLRIQREAVQPRLEAAVLARRDAATVLNEARQSLEGV